VARGHDYLTLVCDLTEGMVQYLADKRKQAGLDGYFTPLAPAQCDQIEAVAMDMWEPYIQSAQAHVPRSLPRSHPLRPTEFPDVPQVRMPCTRWRIANPLARPEKRAAARKALCGFSI
jgi:hypothetical protein